ncbi:MAG: hypothetical protein HYZ28_22645 [Myxococcales bacterium]|nr:hypothetical protein [Myxococcales bacterium]
MTTRRDPAATGGREAEAGQNASLPSIDVLSSEAQEELSRWSEGDRALFGELMQDAGSEVQREMLRRALAAGHSPAELHAFADAMRAMPDEEIFAACTLGDGGRAPHSIVARLRAEADPIYGFTLNGHLLTPKLDDDPGPAYSPAGRAKIPLPPPSVMVRPPPEPLRKAEFEQESSVARGRKLDLHDLGASPDSEPSAMREEGRIAEELLNEAVRPLGIAYREQAVDGPKLKLEKAIEAAHAALARGVPVPVILGPAVGEYRRYALILQVVTTGKSRAFQIHDPFAQETVWVNEGDLFARAELPFAQKSLRRITAIALPRTEPKPLLMP